MTTNNLSECIRLKSLNVVLYDDMLLVPGLRLEMQTSRTSKELLGKNRYKKTRIEDQNSLWGLQDPNRETRAATAVVYNTDPFTHPTFILRSATG